MTLLRWPGSKADDAERIAKMLADNARTHAHRKIRYFEPFLGAGHVWKAIAADAWVSLNALEYRLSDSTFPLIAAWEAARMFPRRTCDVLLAAYGAGGVRDLKVAEHIFDRAVTQRWLRPPEARAASWAPPDIVLPAAWLLYVINTCFNGLYRVDQTGAFNAPFGKRQPNLDEIVLRIHAFSELLAGKPVELSCADFELAVADAKEGDLVYLDPPYTPKSKTSSFAGYTGDGFGELDRDRLARTFNLLVERGCFVALSDADVPEVRARYGEHHLIPLSETRAVAARSSSRAPTPTLLIVPKRMAM